MAKKKTFVLERTPLAPKSLGEIGRAHWREIFSSLVALGLATEMDKPVIEMACAMYERFRTAEDEKDRQSAIASYLRIMAKYGATPKDRKIMKLSAPKGEELDADVDLEEELGL